MSTDPRLPLLIAAALFLCAPAAAQWKDWDYDLDQEKKEWEEIKAQIPPYPKTENLIPFEVGGAAAHRYYIDAPSISIGADAVVRYTLVVKAAGGATNVSFEGIRCDMRQQKSYAIGHPDGTWSQARDPQWRRIEYSNYNRHHGILYVDFFCSGRKPVRTPEEAIQALKYGTRPNSG
jgi:CNP1-like family protein